MRILRDIQAQRRSDLQTLTESCVFAAKAVVATVLVVLLYRGLGKGSAMWAAVSAVLVLQPRFQHSLAASVIRVIANLLGAGIGVVVSLAIPDRLEAVLISLVMIILACEWLRLDVRVAGATFRDKDPLILTPEQFGALLQCLVAEPARTLVIVAACLGLRRVGAGWTEVVRFRLAEARGDDPAQCHRPPR